jgi:hypothetical protein
MVQIWLLNSYYTLNDDDFQENNEACYLLYCAAHRQLKFIIYIFFFIFLYRTNFHTATIQPPVAPERATELGQWTERRIEVSGISWDMNSTDIAVSGLGWYSLGLKGRATVSVHTFDGIDVTQRDAMILHRAKFLERPGFLLPIAIANAIGEETRKKNERMKGQQSDDDDLLDDESSE